MPIEIERKFCVQEMPNLTARSGVAIAQGYLAVDAAGTEIRVRRKGGQYYQTVKTGMGIKRIEVEMALTRAQFDILWPLTAGKRIKKVRYELIEEKWTIELDVYRGRLKGLVIAEVEFESVAESARFVPPPWFGREVTDDARYKNANLAQRGLPDERTQ